MSHCSLKNIIVSFAFVSLISCQKETSDTKEEIATVTELSIGTTADGGHSVLKPQEFYTVATVSGCLPYNIRFGGFVDYKINTVYNQDGTVSHFTRQWSIKGLTATAWIGSNPNSNTPYKINGEQIWFDVVAGQEMFSIKDPKLNSAGTGPASITKPTGTVFIHQGTLVLENTKTHERIVIRHQILKVPGQEGVFKSGWYIQGKRCG